MKHYLYWYYKLFHYQNLSFKMRTLQSMFIFAIISMAFTTNKMDMNLPYHQIPDYPEDFSSGNIVSRMIDGLGYRYYWATEVLTEADLSYKPSDLGKSTLQTIEHIYGLSGTVVNA